MPPAQARNARLHERASRSAPDLPGLELCRTTRRVLPVTPGCEQGGFSDIARTRTCTGTGTGFGMAPARRTRRSAAHEVDAADADIGFEPLDVKGHNAVALARDEVQLAAVESDPAAVGFRT